MIAAGVIGLLAARVCSLASGGIRFLEQRADADGEQQRPSRRC
jgi:hypothetical protein